MCVQQPSELGMLQKAAIVLCNPQAIIFFGMALLMGYGIGTIDTYLFLYLDELGANLTRAFTRCRDASRHTLGVAQRVLVGQQSACDAAGGSELLMGLTITITCVAEVPVFFFTGWLLEAVGVKIVLHGVLAVYILRLLYYSILRHLVRHATRSGPILPP